MTLYTRPGKQKSTEKIDGVVATTLAPHRAIRFGLGTASERTYHQLGLHVLKMYCGGRNSLIRCPVQVGT
ncbi:hypothetical protein CYJ19_05045 [Winkia neuii]|uniref:Uncharacterized protein n=1 Tax=Winkia neuii TaxID=33007 RepID=A0A2I1IM90_9ACTO|nr:hypothetical protein CYJ19_05045 [Winkia neuii]